jgi:hypothetical protein
VNDLLTAAIDAHGGLDRWNTLRTLRVGMSVTGAIWAIKGKPDVFADVTLTVDLHTQRLTVESASWPGRRCALDGHHLTWETTDGDVIEARADPEAAFAGQLRETPWDELQAGYFLSEALWTYLTTPFLYTYDGVETEEIAPIRQNGEDWRGLQITFPLSIATHTRTQVSRFGPDGLLRRHDYTVDILGGSTGLNYAYDYRDVDGIVLPMRRRVYAYKGDFEMVPEPLLVAIDVHSATFA